MGAATDDESDAYRSSATRLRNLNVAYTANPRTGRVMGWLPNGHPFGQRAAPPTTARGYAPSLPGSGKPPRTQVGVGCLLDLAGGVHARRPVPSSSIRPRWTSMPSRHGASSASCVASALNKPIFTCPFSAPEPRRARAAPLTRLLVRLVRF